MAIVPSIKAGLLENVPIQKPMKSVVVISMEMPSTKYSTQLFRSVLPINISMLSLAKLPEQQLQASDLLLRKRVKGADERVGFHSFEQ